MKYLLLATICTAISPWLLYAEIVTLKDGQKIEGTIVCEMQEDVVVWTRRGPITVARKAIKSIEKMSVQPQAERADQSKAMEPSPNPQPSNPVKSDATTSQPKPETVKPQPPTVLEPKSAMEQKPPGEALREILAGQKPGIHAEPIPSSVTALPDSLRLKIETAIEVFIVGEFEQQNLAQKELVALKNKAVPYLGYLLRVGGGHKYYLRRLISTLQEIKTPQAGEQLYLYVRKAGGNADLAAVKALSSYQNPQLFPLLKQLVLNSNAGVTMAALDTLAQQTSPQKIPILVYIWVSKKIAAKNDINMMVSDHTEELLKNLWEEAKKQPEKVGPILLKPLESGQVTAGPFQKKLIERIDFIHYTESVEVFQRLLNSQPELFSTIVAMFGRFGTEAAQTALVQILEQTPDQEVEKKLLLLKTLSNFKIGTTATPLVPYLLGMLGSEDPILAQAALETLAKYSGKNFEKNLTGWHYWWEEVVRLGWNDKSNLPQPQPQKIPTEDEEAAAEEKSAEAEVAVPAETANEVSESNTAEASESNTAPSPAND